VCVAIACFYLLGGAVRRRGVGEVLLLLGVVRVGVALGRDVLAVADVLRTHTSPISACLEEVVADECSPCIRWRRSAPRPGRAYLRDQRKSYRST